MHPIFMRRTKKGPSPILLHNTLDIANKKAFQVLLYNIMWDVLVKIYDDSFSHLLCHFSFICQTNVHRYMNQR